MSESAKVVPDTTRAESKAVALEPCPFCGKTEPLRIIAASELDDEDTDARHPETWAINCDGSRAGRVIAGGCGATSGFRFSEAAAVVAWNRRTPPAVSRSDGK